MEEMTKVISKELLFQHNLQHAYRRKGIIAHNIVKRYLRMLELRHVRAAVLQWKVGLRGCRGFR